MLSAAVGEASEGWKMHIKASPAKHTTERGDKREERRGREGGKGGIEEGEELMEGDKERVKKRRVRK